MYTRRGLLGMFSRGDNLSPLEERIADVDKSLRSSILTSNRRDFIKGLAALGLGALAYLQACRGNIPEEAPPAQIPISQEQSAAQIHNTPYVTESGDRVLFYVQNREIGSLTKDGSRVAGLEQKINGFSPVFDPNKRRLYFIRGYEVMYITIPSDKINPDAILTHHSKLVTEPTPSWIGNSIRVSPNGSYVAHSYTSDMHRSPVSLHVSNAEDGQDSEFNARIKPDTTFAWLNDQEIMYSNPADQNSLYIFNLATGQEYKVSNSPLNVEDFDYRNGRVVMGVRQSENVEIKTARLEARTLSDIVDVTNGHKDTNPVFINDDEIAFIREMYRRQKDPNCVPIPFSKPCETELKNGIYRASLLDKKPKLIKEGSFSYLTASLFEPK